MKRELLLKYQFFQLSESITQNSPFKFKLTNDDFRPLFI